MKRAQIVILNIVLIGLCSFVLYEDYLRVGEFRWTDPNDVEDGDELFINVISVVAIFFGLVSLFSQCFLRRLYLTDSLGIVLFLLNSFYGLFLVVIGGLFCLSITISLLDNKINNLGEIILFIKLISVFIGILYLGMIIFRQLLKPRLEYDLS